MFLKQEKPEMDDFEEEFLEFLTDTLAKMSQYIFAYSFVSEHPKLFFRLRKKNLHFLEADGVDR